MGPRYVYKDMLDNVVSLIACVSMNHQYQFEQMEEEAMFTTKRKKPMGKRRSKRGLVLTQGTLLVWTRNLVWTRKCTSPPS
jgi:hypothetical protein